MLNNITAFEHEALPVGTGLSGAHLTSEEAERLCALGDSLRGFCSRGYHSLKLSQYCGIVNLGERLLEILPKVGERSNLSESQRVLLRLLRNSSDVPIHRDHPVGNSVRAVPLLEIFVEMFFGEVAQIVRQGLLRRYQQEEDDLVCVRGTIAIQRQFTGLANRTDRIACRYDELTADNVWNRAVRMGLRLVYRWIKSLGLQRRWVELMASFAEVDEVAPSSLRLDALVYDRQVERYRSALRWVELFQSLLAPELRAGQRRIPGLLLDMNLLFEESVEVRFGRVAQRVGWSLDAQASQNRRHLGQTVEPKPRRVFGLRPDLLLVRSGTIGGIADAKWKRPDRDSRGRIIPGQDDVYQLLSYSAAYECERLALVYPADRSEECVAYDLAPVGHRRPRITIMSIQVTDDALPVSGLDEWLR